MKHDRAHSGDLGLELRCIAHGVPLERQPDRTLTCARGCAFPVVNGITRFVSPDNYAASFGLQWNHFRRTQLDSFTGQPISRTRLTRLLGGSLDIVKGKRMVEAGCGAGRFTELLLAAGAHVLATDLSSAVEANRENCGHFPNYEVWQADIRALPLAPAQLDIVMCVGVVQHTPDPEETMRALCSYVKPGGMLVLDHYTEGAHAALAMRLLRRLLLRRPPHERLQACETLVKYLWPAHQLSQKLGRLPLGSLLRGLWLRVSPIVDYYDAYPELGAERLREWALLDTHDALTDRFKHLRSADELRRHLSACGMHRIETVNAGNGVEVRAWKPAA